MKLKVIVGVVLFFLAFFGEIAMTFSFKRDSNRNLQFSARTPFTYNLTNELSTNEFTYPVDSIISQFMAARNIVGASVAIASKGKLVYAKGFGYADKEISEMVEPKSLFRIASVSKLITGVAIMKLYEEGRIDLESTVFGPKGILNDSVFMNYVDKRVEDIRVMNLLDHTGGWNGQKGDPIFNSLYIARKMGVEPPASLDDIIRYQLSQKLDYKPGTIYSYSNFGYAVAGRIIEKITGMAYEDYVQFAILHPLGIYDMHIGNSFYWDKYPHEVKYYDTDDTAPCYAYDGSGELVPIPYGGNNIQLLGAAGGWIASAPELLKLIVSIDGIPGKTDILSDQTIELMTRTPKVSRHLLGWRGTDGHGTWWRTGTLAGTAALVMRLKNGIDWVVIFNTTTKDRSKIHNEISRTMFSVLHSVRQWPGDDLFTYVGVENAGELN